MRETAPRLHRRSHRRQRPSIALSSRPSLRSAIGCSTRSRRNPKTSCGGCRICFAARSPTVTRRPSSSGRSIFSCRTSRRRSWPRPRSRGHRAEARVARATFPRTFVAQSGSVTKGGAPLPERAADARSGGTSNGTTSSRSAIRGRRRWRTSPSGVAPTTFTRASSCSAVSTRRSSARGPESMLFPGKSSRSGTAPQQPDPRSAALRTEGARSRRPAAPARESVTRTNIGTA